MNKQLEAEFWGAKDFIPSQKIFTFMRRVHTEARKELIAEVEGMKLLEVGFSPERLHHKQHHNQIIDSILNHLRDEGRE